MATSPAARAGVPATAATSSPAENRAYLELIANSKERFDAVARRDWKHDLGLLRELVSSDPQAVKIVREGIGHRGLLEGLVLRITKLFSSDEYEGEAAPDGINYYQLAGQQELVQKALAAKDWSRTPDQARIVLGLNPYEAAALKSQDAPKATKLLWNKYHPYKVWYYLGLVGLIGTIGMIIFYFATKKPKEAPPAAATAQAEPSAVA